MSHKKIYNLIILGSIIFAAGLILLGCSGTSHDQKTADNKVAGSVPESEKGSAQLWSENCGRCHNMRNPASYSDVQWDVAMHHMRVRADLTATEHRKILEYLQASN